MRSVCNILIRLLPTNAIRLCNACIRVWKRLCTISLYMVHYTAIGRARASNNIIMNIGNRCWTRGGEDDGERNVNKKTSFFLNKKSYRDEAVQFFPCST